MLATGIADHSFQKLRNSSKPLPRCRRSGLAHLKPFRGSTIWAGGSNHRERLVQKSHQAHQPLARGRRRRAGRERRISTNSRAAITGRQEPRSACIKWPLKSALTDNQPALSKHKTRKDKLSGRLPSFVSEGKQKALFICIYLYLFLHFP